MNTLSQEEIADMSTDEKLSALLSICLTNQAKLGAIDDIQNDIKTFKDEVNERCETNEKTVSGFNDRLTALEEAHKAHCSNTNKRIVLGDLYGKKFNTLFHGMHDTNTEEDMETKQATAELILDEYLCIPNWKEKITIVDTHRLPQTPVRPKRGRNAKPVCRPVVIKVATKEEHDLIFKHLTNLATVNSGKDDGEKVYATKHLPREMQSQRKAQLPKFKKARKEGKVAKFKIDFDTADYRLYINDELVPLPKSK